MREYWVEVEQEVSSPRDAVFEFLAEHENLGPLLGGANISRVRDGDTDRNGVGSVRRVKVGPSRPFEETVTRFEPHSLIEYQITKGGPLRNHIGIVALSDASGGGTEIDYRIRIASHIPGLAPLVRRKLTRDITRSIAKLDSRLSAA